ncbi:hypothetical protein HANVADRAFT_25692 [Hanseniaspora valbyensis NRRL Y-1626]|uniref:Ribonuclease n=1 Tax=Hanseniaspora valbyensis NRRL Y-1626 TaxID=766949 RepID=A0A1B7TBV8_9ASCO|nr:hypothetical protein HANVADRAFT_25692 [Hanseniaspora valbyensis NRRL Y-1626]
MSNLPETVQKLLESSHTETYVSPIPKEVLDSNKETPIIIGVDEAGRGPIFGSMVYCAAYVPVSFSESLKSTGSANLKYGFDDSKKLTDVKRDELFGYIWREKNTGYVLTGISARDICSGMMRYPPSEIYNLNQQAHDTTMAMINIISEELKLNVDHVFIDTVGPPESYQRKLEARFPKIKFTVSKKADSIYPIVSVASVIAKVTRDMHLKELSRDNNDENKPLAVGSGYPSDPNTVRFLANNVTPLIGWDPNFTRFSWNTTNSYLCDQNEKYKTLNIKWEDDYITTGRKRSKDGNNVLMNLEPSKTKGMLTIDSFYDI